MPSLAGRIAVVTGAASGIGRGLALSFAQAGATVVVSDMRKEGAQETAELIIQAGGRSRPLQADVSREDDVKTLIDDTVQTWGRIDILVNNAGLQFVAPIEDFPADTFSRLIQVMLVGPFLGIKYAFPHMKRQRYGRILNMASINGLIGFAGKAAYNSAKHGVIGLTKVAALECAQEGITVNALCPGYVDTPLVRNQMRDLAATRGVPEDAVLEDVILRLVPQHRLLDITEVADYATYLVSDQARGITGQAVVIDGGYVAQ